MHKFYHDKVLKKTAFNGCYCPFKGLVFKKGKSNLDMSLAPLPADTALKTHLSDYD